jgi:2-polyprenyl-3-methyl-5-hydroxy-6-metoxy-1,4-benzoquinol methylase
MPQYSFDEHYVEALRSAMRSWETRQYVLLRIDESLRKLGLHDHCVIAVISLLTAFLRQAVTAGQLAEMVAAFQRDWRIHLDRKYLNEYEATRWSFMKQYVFFPGGAPRQLGRCLDLGCGRGCITSTIYRNGLASSVVGIDSSNFDNEWNERVSEWQGDQPSGARVVEYKAIPIGQIETWLKQAGQFDTILLFYVLHHSEDYWAARTLDALKGSLSANGCLIILEDALDTDPGIRPVSDELDLTRKWRNWAQRTKRYCLTPAYDAQIVLDFVAVQLLAGFWDVRMPCNYRTSLEWRNEFQQIGYEVVTARYIGFPEGRDIDVPQAVFILKLPDAAGGASGSEPTGAV